MNLRIAAAIALGLGTSAAHGVYLNPRGSGQVLVYPYYTTNAGQATLVTIVNTTDKGKAIKLRFHEGYNGRGVLDFNVYLSPYDVWAAAIALTQTGDDEPASILTNDNSCTVPQFDAPGQGTTARSLGFSTASFTGNNNDTGPISGARTREGHFDVIEMGEVTDATHGSLTAITQVNGVPANCAQLTSAWATGGYWATDPTTDLSPPGGGLYGAESIIDVAQGTIYTINAEAIDGFSAIIQHTAPGSAAPDLNTANDGPASALNMVTAQVPANGTLLQAQYENPVDAISALFMADTLYNEYEIDPATGSQSDWVVTFPTKRFYVDPAITGNILTAQNPFDELFGAFLAGQSCSQFGPRIFDREATSLFPVGDLDYGPDPSFSGFAFCFDTSVITFGTAASVLHSQLMAGDVSTIRGAPTGEPFTFTSGHIAASLTQVEDGQGNFGPATTHVLSTSANNYVFYGLPAFGFFAVSYVNANVTPGVLANYSGLFPHRASVTCNTNTSPQVPCQ